MHLFSEELSDTISRIRQPNCDASEDIFEEALKKYSGKLSLADCFIYFFAKKMEAELFTFDKNLQKALK